MSDKPFLANFDQVCQAKIIFFYKIFVQLLSRVWLFAIPQTAALQAFLSFSISQSFLKFMSNESVIPSNHLILCCPLLLLPSIFPNISGLFANEPISPMSWLFVSGTNYWSFSFSINLYNEYSGLLSFRIDWFDLLAVQGTLNSLLQHHSSKASILQHLAFFMAQLSHPYMTTGNTIALTIWIFVSQVILLLFNMLSKFVTTFLPMNNRLLISWLPSASAVILEPKKIKPVTVSIFSYSICHEVMGPDAMIFVFWMLSFKPDFSFVFSKRLFVLLPFLPLGWYHLHIWRYWYFSQQSWFQLVLHPAWHFTWCTLCIS